ncbi:MAG: aminotransferase class V-fold PLP-dependent enzyme [Pseudomonadota bacterium]
MSLDLHAEFPLEDGLLHLNHAAVGPWPQRTREAVCAFAAENAQQGSRHYLRWLETEADLRRRLAAFINAPDADDIALVKNTSEGLSLVAWGLDWLPGDRIVTSTEEFPSNRIVWESLAPLGVELVEVDLQSAEDPEAALEAALDERTRLLAISSVQYGSGLALDLERLGRACRERGVLFGIDAIQSLGATAMDVAACHADFLAADGHKWLLAPEGLAVFYTSAELRERLHLYQYGWHMVEHVGDFNRREWVAAASARRFEPGSPNMVAVHALAASLSLFEEVGMAVVERAIRDRAHWLVEAIQGEPLLELLSRPEKTAGIITFRHREKETEALYESLMARGVLCAQRGGGIRFSPHFYTPMATLEGALHEVLWDA